MNNPIKFSELRKFNDSNSIVVAGVIIEENQITDVNEWFHEIGLLPEGKDVTAMHVLSDNVLGTEGRRDTLLELSGEGISNPMVRLKLRLSGFNVSWTSDFIDNYKKDYKSKAA